MHNVSGDECNCYVIRGKNLSDISYKAEMEDRKMTETLPGYVFITKTIFQTLREEF